MTTTNTMTKLSPNAQAVLDALLNTPVNSRQVCDGKAPQVKLAAALRAAADQVVPEVDLHVSVANDLLPKDIGAAKWSARYEVRCDFLAIAAELDPPPSDEVLS